VAKLAPSQIEQLHSIGAYLRQVRQEQGLSLDAVANQIFIRPVLLNALETGNDAELPEPVFVQGFIRRYADALGLDGQALSSEFSVTPVDVLPTPELLEQADTNGVVEPETRHSIRVLEKAEAPAAVSPLPSKSPIPWIVGLGALLLALGLGIWAIAGRDQTPSTVDEPVDELPSDELSSDELPSDEAASLESDLAPESVEEGEPATLAPSLEAPVVVDISLRERSWLSVTADGETVFEGTSEEGFEETWTAEDTLVLTTGNAGGVELAVNGDEAVVIGETGDVKTLTITPDSDAEEVLDQ
jgi:cytoskeleton protein RodZ